VAPSGMPARASATERAILLIMKLVSGSEERNRHRTVRMPCATCPTDSANRLLFV
jgi:hypothetical protein